MAKNKKVLIIDDEEFILKALAIKLEELEIDFIARKDGESGLKAIIKEKPDLVLLDLILPKMYGYEVIKEVKKNKETEKIPIIVFTNIGKKEVEKKIKGLKIHDFIGKADTSLDVVVERIQKFI